MELSASVVDQPRRRFQNCDERCCAPRRGDLRDDIILIAAKPFFDFEAIVLKPSVDIALVNDTPERRTWALTRQGTTFNVQSRWIQAEHPT
jgi:hypothetical protein